MPEITLRNPAGESAGTVELDDAVFGLQPNVSVMHQVVTAQLAKRRAGTQSTKTRSEVRGGGAKPYRQKGTGNARQGSTNAPHYVGGGVAFGPKPRSYAQRTPKKMIRLALRSALSDRASEGRIIVVDEWSFESPKTKDARIALAALGVEGRVLVVVDREDATTARSFRNLPEVQLIQSGELNAYDVLCNEWIVFTKGTLPAALPTDTRRADRAVVSTQDEVTQHGPGAHADDPAEGPRDEHDANAPSTVQALAATADTVADDAAVDAPYGAGSHAALDDGVQPDGFDIKGNADSMLYHVPGSAFYERTVAEVWFASAETAEAAGFQLPPSQRDDDTADADAESAADAPTVQAFAASDGADAPYGEGSHAPLDDDGQPDGFDIKGNADSMLYHVPGSAFYERTVAEVWFASAETAEAAGFQRPPSQRDTEASSDDDTADDTQDLEHGGAKRSSEASEASPESEQQ